MAVKPRNAFVKLRRVIIAITSVKVDFGKKSYIHLGSTATFICLLSATPNYAPMVDGVIRINISAIE
jgi:hypothetical protein